MNPTRRCLRLAAILACVLAGPAAGYAAEEIPTTITADLRAEMISTDTETKITFHKNVVVTGTNLKLTCDYLEIVVLRTGDKAATIGKIEKFRSLLATGNVLIIQGDREAACGRAEVLPGEDKIVLSEKPVIVFHDEGGRQSGEKITLWRGQRRVEIDKPESVLPAIKDLGFGQEAKPAAPPAAAPAVAAPPSAPAPAAEPPKQP